MSPESRQAELLARWLDQRAQGDVHPEPPDGLDLDVVDAVSALRPDRAPAPRVTLDDILFEVADGPMAEAVDPRHVRALAGWLDEDSLETELPADLDPDILDAVSVLKPERAPAPRVSIDDILAEVSAGPLHEPEAAGASVDNVVALHPAAPPPEEVAQAEAPKRRKLPVWLYPSVAGLAMAATALLFVAPTAQEAMDAPPATSTAQPSWDGVAAEVAEAEEEEAAPATASRGGGGLASGPLAKREAAPGRTRGAPAKDAAYGAARPKAVATPAPPPAPVAAAAPKGGSAGGQPYGGLTTERQQDAATTDALQALGYVDEAEPSPDPEPMPEAKPAEAFAEQDQRIALDDLASTNTGLGLEAGNTGAWNSGATNTGGDWGDAEGADDWGGAANTGLIGGSSAAGRADTTVADAELLEAEDSRAYGPADLADADDDAYYADAPMEEVAVTESARRSRARDRLATGAEDRKEERARNKQKKARSSAPPAASAPAPEAPEEPLAQDKTGLADLRRAATVPAQSADVRLQYRDAYAGVDAATTDAGKVAALEALISHPVVAVGQDAAYRLARHHLVYGRRDLAVAAIARGLGRAGGTGADRARLHALKGEILEQMGDERGATMSYEQAIDAQ